MSIYNIDQDVLNSAYSTTGSLLQHAYDVNGNRIYGQDEQSTLTVMSYNIQWRSGLNANQNMQSAIINTYNADIVGLQEWTTMDTSVKPLNFPYFSQYSEQALGIQYNKTAIVSKPHLTDVVGHVFETQRDETKGYQTCYFVHGGKNIFWLNCHMMYDYQDVIAAQCTEVFNVVKDKEYFIVTGDFNVTCKSTTDAMWVSCMKQFIDAGFNSANCSEQHGFLDTWTSGKDTSGTCLCLDQIITSSNITIDEVIVDQQKLNYLDGTNPIDHLPIIARLTIT